MKKVVVMISGGIDSTTILAGLERGQWEGFSQIYPLVISNNSRFFLEKQIIFVEKIAKNYGLHLAFIESTNPEDLVIATREMGASEDYIPGYQTSIYFPAMAYAERVGTNIIYSGLTHEDSLGRRPEELLPGRQIDDDTPRAVEKMQTLYNSLYDTEIIVKMPLAQTSKPGVLTLGRILKVPFNMTCSCSELHPNNEDVWHCGKCRKCRERKLSFSEAGMHDPVKYGDEM